MVHAQSAGGLRALTERNPTVVFTICISKGDGISMGFKSFPISASPTKKERKKETNKQTKKESKKERKKERKRQKCAQDGQDNLTSRESYITVTK